jgi:hypothetical protein
MKSLTFIQNMKLYVKKKSFKKSMQFISSLHIIHACIHTATSENVKLYNTVIVTETERVGITKQM